MAVAELDHAAFPRSYIFYFRQRLTFASLVEILPGATRRIKQCGPRIGLVSNLIGDQQASGRSVADPPSIESRCHVKTRTLLLRRLAGKRHAIGSIVVFVGPVPYRFSGLEI